MVKEKPRQYKAELESFKSFTHRVRDLVQFYVCWDFQESLVQPQNSYAHNKYFGLIDMK